MENMGPAGMGTLAINPQGSWLVGLLWFQDTLSWALPLWVHHPQLQPDMVSGCSTDHGSRGAVIPSIPLSRLWGS